MKWGHESYVGVTNQYLSRHLISARIIRNGRQIVSPALEQLDGYELTIETVAA